MDDQNIITLFLQRSEDAIGETDKKYGPLCRRLSENILRDPQDAEECVNDAYLGVWNTVPPENPNPFLAYLCRIVRNLSLKRYAYNRAEKRNSTYDIAIEELESCLASPDCPEQELEAKELTGVVEAFLRTLTTENRVIFLRRYWFSDAYGDIAKQTGLSEKNVSVRLVRLRRQLRTYLKERGYLE